MENKGNILTLGTFDGVHRGHQALLNSVTTFAKELHLKSLALTFTKPPRLYFSPSKEPTLLTTIQEKRRFLNSIGIDRVRVLNFNQSLASVSATDFFNRIILRQCGAKGIVVGYNFCFGSSREGTIPFLKKMAKRKGIRVEVLPPLLKGERPISSGWIRESLKRGHLKLANDLLGRAYSAEGTVVPGLGIGKKIGFPTLNFKVDPMKILPEGVFVVKVNLKDENKFWIGMANVGVRPTIVEELKNKRLEVHLLNFRGNLYGETLTAHFLKKIRSEKKFDSLGSLKAQLKKDLEVTKHSLFFRLTRE